MTKHRYLSGLLPAAVAGLAAPLLLAACSGPPSSPSVAGLGTAAASASASSTSTLSAYQQGLAFSACMRAHGLPDFPDPQHGGSGGGGGIQISGSGGIDPNSPTFQAAMDHCQSLLRAGKGGPGGVRGKALDASKVPAWAACIRSHGVPDFPDPKIVDNGMQLSMTGVGDKTAFRTAMTACQSKFPGGDLSVSVGGGTGAGGPSGSPSAGPSGAAG